MGSSVREPVLAQTISGSCYGAYNYCEQVEANVKVGGKDFISNFATLRYHV